MLVTHGHAHLMHATKADCSVFNNPCIVKQYYTYADVHSASETCYNTVYTVVCVTYLHKHASSLAAQMLLSMLVPLPASAEQNLLV